MTYGRLFDDVCRVAGFLASEGLARGDRVGVFLDNSPEYVALYYATLAAGGVVVPLTASAKSRALAARLRHSGATWLAYDGGSEEAAAALAEVGLRGIAVGKPRAGSHSFEEAKAAPRVEPFPRGPEELASIVYTSGTTGEPKGVMLSHRNLVANTLSILGYLELSEDDSCLNVLPFSYSYGNSVLHTHLAAGGRLVLENSLAYPHRVLGKMADEAVTGFPGVPSTFALLLSRTKLQDFDLGALRYLTQAGGPMPPANIARLRGELPKVRLFVMYGQTEATARLTYLPPEFLEEKMGSVGRGIPGVEIEVRDGEARVESGVRGEVCARGDNVMMGYWANPEATGRVLRDGWLHTGDLGRMDADGFLYIEGRRSDMIKVGAHRVSPQEIEEVITELPGVVEVAAVGTRDEILGQTVKVVIVASAGAAIDERTVQAHCRRLLDAHKVPRRVEFTTTLPRTASGKIQRHLLSGGDD